jgi:hypothetical protein
MSQALASNPAASQALWSVVRAAAFHVGQAVITVGVVGVVVISLITILRGNG